MHVARDKQIDVAIAIVVTPSRASAESAANHASFVGHVLELAVAQVVIESVAAEAGDVDILQAVVVIIGNGHSHAPTFARKSGGFCDVSEFGNAAPGVAIVRLLMVERDHGIAALAITRNGRTVDGDDIEFAIVIAIDEANAATHGFDNIFLVGRRNVRDGKAGFLRDIFKLRQRLARTDGMSFLWCGRRRFHRRGLGRQQSR